MYESTLTGLLSVLDRPQRHSRTNRLTWARKFVWHKHNLKSLSNHLMGKRSVFFRQPQKNVWSGILRMLGFSSKNLPAHLLHVFSQLRLSHLFLFFFFFSDLPHRNVIRKPRTQPIPARTLITLNASVWIYINYVIYVLQSAFSLKFKIYIQMRFLLTGLRLNNV